MLFLTVHFSSLADAILGFQAFLNITIPESVSDGNFFFH